MSNTYIICENIKKNTLNVLLIKLNKKMKRNRFIPHRSTIAEMPAIFNIGRITLLYIRTYLLFWLQISSAKDMLRWTGQFLIPEYMNM